MPESVITAEMRAAIGEKWEPFVVEIDKRSCRLFAQAAGYTDPIYYDEKVAQSYGYRSIPVPPAFLGHVALMPGQLDPYIKAYFRFEELPLRMNGSNDTEYFSDMCAGDVLNLNITVTDVFEKQGKKTPIIFVVTQWDYRNQANQKVASFQATGIALKGLTHA